MTKEVGTLKELNVKPGDVVQTYATPLNNGGVWTIKSCVPDIMGIKDNYGPYHKGVPLAPSYIWQIISRAPNKPHTIHHEGKEYDLTKLENPFGLLPEPVQEALRAWPHGWVLYNRSFWCTIKNPYWIDSKTYRAKPAPEVKEWVLYWCKDMGAASRQQIVDTHRITLQQTGDGPVTATVEELS